MMDLFVPIVENSTLHPNWKAMVRAYPRSCKFLNSLSDGFADRDGKFIKQFQTTFNSSFWELYLYACLKKLQFDIDLGFDRPDFIAAHPTFGNLIIEATTANHSQSAIAEWDTFAAMSPKDIDIDKIVERATIRLAGSIAAKLSKYESSYCNLPHVKKQPFAIAVAPFDGPFFYFQGTQAIRRVLYGHDAAVPASKAFERFPLRQILMDRVFNGNGAELRLGLFNDSRFSFVSCVIFSTCATFGKIRILAKEFSDQTLVISQRNDGTGLHLRDSIQKASRYNESLLDGLKIFHNPNAKHPVNREAFSAKGMAQYFFHPDTGSLTAIGLENHLEIRILR